MIIIDLFKLILSKNLTKNAFVLSNRLVVPPTSICVRYLKEPHFPPLVEHEIVEIFARGSGPGGQKLNKTANRVQIKHIPTGNFSTTNNFLKLESYSNLFSHLSIIFFTF